MPLGDKVESSSQIQNMDAAAPTKLTAFQGVLHTAIAIHEMAGVDSEVQVRMVRMPAGARIMDGQCWWDAMGDNTFITIGDEFDTDRFMTTCPTNRAFVSGATDRGEGLSLPASGVTSGRYFTFGTGRFNRVSGGTGTISSAEVGIGYRYTSETDIRISFNDVAASGTIALKVDYIVS